MICLLYYIEFVLKPLLKLLNKEFLKVLFTDLNLYYKEYLIDTNYFYEIITYDNNIHILSLILSLIYIKFLIMMKIKMQQKNY